MAYDPNTKQPLGLFWKGTSCNPILSPDCDDPDDGAKTNGNKKKNDKDKSDEKDTPSSMGSNHSRFTNGSLGSGNN
jgi:hypothetical protein